MTPERERQIRETLKLTKTHIAKEWCIEALDAVAKLREEIAQRRAYGEMQYKEWNYHLDVSPSCNEGRLWRPTEDDGPRLMRMPNIDYSQEVLEALEEGPDVD